MNKRIVITGATGFLGSHLVNYLSKQGFVVYAIKRKNSRNKSLTVSNKNIHIIESELSDYETLCAQIEKPVSALIHVAWHGVSPEARDSIEIQKSNLDLCIEAVNLAYKLNAEKFIFPGSTLEYSYSGNIINRDIKPSPQNAYGATKVAAKYYCEIMCHNLNVPFIYTVISGIYSEDRLDNNVINYTITELLNCRRPSLTKLEQLWDYVYIDDVVEAFKLIIEKGRENGFYVIGHGDNWPLSNYIFKIRDIINPNAELGIGEVPYKNTILPMSCVDLTEIKEDTGFIAHTSFEKGIVNVIDGIKRREEIK